LDVLYDVPSRSLPLWAGRARRAPFARSWRTDQRCKTFPQRGPRDKQGRSLRDFDLKTRLFRYPLSYMIYSAAFDGMPDLVRDRVYRRLYDILAGQDSSKSVGGLSLENLSADDRRAILEIVRETKLNLPAYWTNASAQKPR
jgi:hypothetical protein